MIPTQYPDDRDRQLYSGGGESGFLEALFDFTFSQFVTVKVVRVLYVIMLIVAVFAAVVIVFSLFSEGLLFGLFSILLAPLGFLVVMLVARVWLEMLVVLFRVADYLREINSKVK
jgi:hypothetical protein